MMEISTKGRYASRIMVYLALHVDDGPVRKKEIAGAEDISADYAEQLLVKLKAGGLVSRRPRWRNALNVLLMVSAEISISSPCSKFPRGTM